jgi:hypothetical protein
MDAHPHADAIARDAFAPGGLPTSVGGLEAS